jgi:pimeloyl-ACP methyl ester carboxylesterase
MTTLWMRSNKKMIFTVLLALILLLVLLGLRYEASLSRQDAQRYPPPGSMVDIGGYRLHILCTGEGGPTVILDSGLGDSGQVWALIQQKLSDRIRVCSYDRAGLGWSEPGPLPRTYQQAATELHELLKQAGEAPPFVLVGHSAGVNTVRMFAENYPEEVAGLVLIEPPILPEGVPPALVAVLRGGRIGMDVLARTGVIRLLGETSRMSVLFNRATPPVELSERAGFLYRPQTIKASLDEIAAIQDSIRQVNETARPNAWRDMPVTILAAYKGSALPKTLAQALQSLAQLSTKGRVVSVPGSHFLQLEQPDLVVQTIFEVIEVTRRR